VQSRMNPQQLRVAVRKKKKKKKSFSLGHEKQFLSLLSRECVFGNIVVLVEGLSWNTKAAAQLDDKQGCLVRSDPSVPRFVREVRTWRRSRQISVAD
jgi:hypothetical protein